MGLPRVNRGQIVADVYEIENKIKVILKSDFKRGSRIRYVSSVWPRGIIRRAWVSRGNLLLIEDEDRLRKNLSTLLGRDGYCITAAANGIEGIAYAQSLLIDVVVTDLIMEAFDRFELLEQLVTFCPKTPIIVMTGHDSILTADEALSKGAFDYLAKPFSIGLLRTAIVKAIQQSPAPCS